MSKRSESLEDLTDDFLHCRDQRHRWGKTNMTVTETTKKGHVRQISRWRQCDMCLTELEEVFEFPSCDKVKQRYVYQDGYLLGPDALTNGRVDVRDIRRQVFGRSGIL